MRDDERAERERLYREGIATYEANDTPTHLTAAAIVACHMCDDDGYRQNRICDHQDRTQTASRGPCPDTLHDWPLPAGYGDAHEVAAARIAARWSNRKCPACGLYGWAPGTRQPASTNPIHVPAESQP